MHTIEVSEHFYVVLERSGDLGLRNIVSLVDLLLEQPLHPCEHCDAAFAHYAALDAQRIERIEAYAPQRMHPALFTGEIQRAWLDAPLSAALALGAGAARDAALRALLRTDASGVYSVQLFAPEMCALLIEEVEHFSACTPPTERSRVNSMNRYGVVLNEIGLELLMDGLAASVLAPILRLAFPRAGQGVDAHHSFVVRYAPDEDTSLDPHTDASHCTANVCLGKDFEGAALTFCGTLGEAAHRRATLRYRHAIGRAVLHLGTRRHGAEPITAGQRFNLIVWCTNIAYGASEAGRATRLVDYPPERSAPDLLCVSRTHDRDASWLLPPRRGEDERGARAASAEPEARQRAWCPSEGSEYPGWGAAAIAAQAPFDGDAASAAATPAGGLRAPSTTARNPDCDRS